MTKSITTLPEAFESQHQAWLTGFRKGVEESLIFDEKLTIENFKHSVQEGAYAVLSLWQNVGRDVEHGIWCILGARMGTYMTMCTNWDAKLVDSEAEIASIWSTIDGHNAEIIAGRVAEELITQLELPIVTLDANSSKFFKFYFNLNASILEVVEES